MVRQKTKDHGRTLAGRSHTQPTRADREQAQKYGRVEIEQPWGLAPDEREQVWRRAGEGAQGNERKTKSRAKESGAEESGAEESGTAEAQTETEEEEAEFEGNGCST